jgi:hypothetical protein
MHRIKYILCQGIHLYIKVDNNKTVYCILDRIRTSYRIKNGSCINESSSLCMRTIRCIITWIRCLGIRTYIGQIRNVSYGKPPLWPPFVSKRKRAGVGRSGAEAAASGGLGGCSSDEMRGPAREEGR